MALLQLRNMPINEKGITPAEIMFKRKVRNLIPNYSKTKIDINGFKNTLNSRQEQQKVYYDKGTKKLKPFKTSDTVKIHSEDKKTPHKSGLIVEVDSNPRSYKVKTENGQVIKRNRKDLTRSNTFNEYKEYNDIQVPISNTPFAEPVNNEILPVNSNNNHNNSNNNYNTSRQI